MIVTVLDRETLEAVRKAWNVEVSLHNLRSAIDDQDFHEAWCALWELKSYVTGVCCECGGGIDQDGTMACEACLEEMAWLALVSRKCLMKGRR